MRYQRSRPLQPTPLLGVAFLLHGCMSASGPPPPAPVEPECTAEELSALQTRIAQLEGAISELQDEVGRRQAEADDAQMELLQKDGRITELEVRLANQGLVLDETINEVVRAKAKLRGAESRAEAVSQIAEAEIALRGLADSRGGSGTPEFRRASELMEQSGIEFEAENYGGAIYLVSQAKALIAEGMNTIATVDIEVAADEVRFERPLPLRVLANSNIRTGPGLDFDVVTTLPAGSPLVGYSYKGEWIHVLLETRRDGWVFRELVGSSYVAPSDTSRGRQDS